MSSYDWAYSYNYVVIDWVTHRPLGGGLARLHLWLENYRFVQFWCDFQDYALGSPNFLITRSPSPPCAASHSFAGAHHYELWTTWVAHQGGPLRVQILFFFSFLPVVASCVKLKNPWNQSPNQRFGWFWSCCGKIGKILWTDKHPKPEMLVIFGSVYSCFSIYRGRSWPVASLFLPIAAPRAAPLRGESRSRPQRFWRSRPDKGVLEDFYGIIQFEWDFSEINGILMVSFI